MSTTLHHSDDAPAYTTWSAWPERGYVPVAEVPAIERRMASRRTPAQQYRDSVNVQRPLDPDWQTVAIRVLTPRPRRHKGRSPRRRCHGR